MQPGHSKGSAWWELHYLAALGLGASAGMDPSEGQMALVSPGLPECSLGFLVKGRSRVNMGCHWTWHGRQQDG